MAETYVPRMKQHYNDVLRDELIKEFSLKNVMQVPKLEKIIINMGVGAGVDDKKKGDDCC